MAAYAFAVSVDLNKGYKVCLYCLMVIEICWEIGNAESEVWKGRERGSKEKVAVNGMKWEI